MSSCRPDLLPGAIDRMVNTPAMAAGAEGL